MSRYQPDLFQPDDQPELFEDSCQPRSYRPDMDHVRALMLRILTEAKGAKSLPWTSTEERCYRAVFPQMARWLPPEEGEQLCFEFAAEIRRLRAA